MGMDHNGHRSSMGGLSPSSSHTRDHDLTTTFKFDRLSMHLAPHDDQQLTNHDISPVSSTEHRKSHIRRKPPPDLIGEVQVKNANKLNEEKLNRRDHAGDYDDIIRDLEDEIGKYNIKPNPVDSINHNTMDNRIAKSTSNRMDPTMNIPMHNPIDNPIDNPISNRPVDHVPRHSYSSITSDSPEYPSQINRFNSFDSTSSNYDSPTKSASSLNFQALSINSLPSIPSNTIAPNNVVPYPLDSPIAPSPTSGLSFDHAYSDNYTPVNIDNINHINHTSYDENALKFTNNSHENFPNKVSPLLRDNSLGRTSQTTATTNKSDQLKPTISTPITNFNFTDSIRNSSSSIPTNASLNHSSNTSTVPSSNLRGYHRKSSSTSSIWSSSSNRNINLATLKKTLNLKPGEGERSNYVLTLRKNAGTAYNEASPGKWKLPTGISPIDKRATYTSSNGAYMRMAGGISQKAKKGSGVELKHGHLAPRLLAAEVDDIDDAPSIRGLKSTTTSSSLGNSLFTTSSSNNSSHNNELKTSNSSIINDELSSSLSRTITKNSLTSSVTTSNEISKTPNSKRSSSISSSSGSISGDDIRVGAFYQHPGYKYDEGDETHKEDETDVDNTDIDDNDSYKEPPKLVLANPDSDSD